MTDKPKNPVGRPKVTLADLRPDWREVMLDLGAQGASAVEIRCNLYAEKHKVMSDDLWDRLIAEDEDFSGTVKKAKLLCEQWWEREGRTSLRDGSFSYTGWYMNMKNRFGWKDKSENNNNNTGTINVEIVKFKKEDLV
jgi:hypothetical protein